jgi:hypothetical protein
MTSKRARVGEWEKIDDAALLGKMGRGCADSVLINVAFWEN